MTEKARCPRCSSQLTKKIKNFAGHYYLICKPCERKQPYTGFRVHFTPVGDLNALATFFNINFYFFTLKLDLRCNLNLSTQKHEYKYNIELYVTYNESYPTIIKTFDGYDLIDQGVDILDYYSLYAFFKKECIRWHKLKAFL